jgi:manganese transport system ATP-binding protein
MLTRYWATETTDAVIVDAVSYSYPSSGGRDSGSRPALDAATLTARTGRITGLVGVNGAGKSTIFKSLMGIITPDVGMLRILGMAPETARKTGLVGYVPQAEDIDNDFPLTVRDVVAMGRYGRLGITRRLGSADHAAVRDAIDQVQLGELADRQIGRLSGGQRRRVFVARGLAQEAQVLLLDEPFAGVDKRSEALIVSVLRDLAGRGGAVLMSTHDLAALPELADHVVLIHHHVLVAGTPGDVLTPENLALAFGGEEIR